MNLFRISHFDLYYLYSNSNIADTINQRPRRILDYHSPAELFEAFLDEVYAIDNIS